MDAPRHSADQVPNADPRLANLTGGSRKGVPNKMTKQVKEMILAALDKAGGVDYLAEQAEKNPGPFMALVGKVLPMQLAGEGDGPIQVVIQRFEDADAVH